MFCDAQVHIWGADRPERPWPSVHGEPHRAEPFTAAEVIAAMDRAGVDRAVIIPPSWEGDRNDLAVEAVETYPGRFGIMARVDLRAQDPVSLDHWRERPGFLGVRVTFHRRESRNWLTDGTSDWLFERAEELRLPVMILAPSQIDAIAAIGKRHPELSLVIDHLNLPVEAAPGDVGLAVEALAPLSALENVSVKISALPCYVDEPFPFPSVAGPIRATVNRFGAERYMWGSDISRLPCPYEDWVRMFRQETGVLDEREVEFVGGGTLCRVLDWR